MKQLYIEFRVYFPVDSNQETIHTMADRLQDAIADECSLDAGAEIPCNEVTYEVVLSDDGENNE
jgi:hypothetical protein